MPENDKRVVKSVTSLPLDDGASVDITKHGDGTGEASIMFKLTSRKLISQLYEIALTLKVLADEIERRATEAQRDMVSMGIEESSSVADEAIVDV